MSDPVLLPHPLDRDAVHQPGATRARGWPDDPAPAGTPVARDAADVRRLAQRPTTLAELDARVSVCSACPRLVRWREDVARDKRASFADQPYWGRPIAGWGDPEPSAADRRAGARRQRRQPHRPGLHRRLVAADWLFASLHRVGLATQETSEHAGDGQRLVDARMVATVRCAPPANKPTVGRARHLRARGSTASSRLLAPTLRVVVALGAVRLGRRRCARWPRAGLRVPRPKPRFGHGARGRPGATAARSRCSAATTPRSTTPSPAG